MVGLHWHRRVLWADNASPTHASFQIGVNPAPKMKVRAGLPEFANRIAEISNAPRVEQGYRRFPNHPVRSVTRRKMATF
jgi:hypothetical protein